MNEKNKEINCMESVFASNAVDWLYSPYSLRAR